MRPIYIAGDMLFKGSILMREQEKQMLLDAGLEVHSPIDDKEINDKSNQTVESNNSLAERIVHKDTAAIMQADTILIEPQHFAQGTLVELGQIKGYNDMNKAIMDIINNGGDIEDIVEYLTVDNPYKKVYAHL